MLTTAAALAAGYGLKKFGKWAINSNAGKALRINVGNVVGSAVHKVVGKQHADKVSEYASKAANIASGVLGKDNTLTTNLQDLASTARGDQVEFRSINDQQQLNQSATSSDGIPYVPRLHTSNFKRYRLRGRHRGKSIDPRQHRVKKRDPNRKSKFIKKF